MRVLVTGATGFVGTVLCEQLAAAGHTVRAAVRSAVVLPSTISEHVVVGDINSRTDWSRALPNVDAVVHAAARVHVLRDAPGNASLYDEVNALGTRQFATASAAAGVKRFLLLSSVKVNGEQTFARPFTAEDPPQPLDAYGESKHRAENFLNEIGRTTAMETAIVRPPLVYGPGVRANFLKLLDLVHAGMPLPFGSVGNRRSLVSVWNLADLLRVLAERRGTSPRTWMVSDGDDVSTAELVRRMAFALGRSARLLPIPPGVLAFGATLLGKREEVKRLCGSLVVDSSPATRELGWTPPVNMEESLRRTAKWYLARGATRND